MEDIYGNIYEEQTDKSGNVSYRKMAKNKYEWRLQDNNPLTYKLISHSLYSTVLAIVKRSDSGKWQFEIPNFINGQTMIGIEPDRWYAMEKVEEHLGLTDFMPSKFK